MQETPNKPKHFCPHCGSGQIHDVSTGSDYHQAVCTDCAAQGPIRRTWEQAAQAFCRPDYKGLVVMCYEDAEYILKCMEEDRKAWDRMHGGRQSSPDDAEQMLSRALRVKAFEPMRPMFHGRRSPK